ncbi:hypothetical protein E2C01_040722 [Portunus trituberculatus]|uniref:Uncharacterized protein n=1 Tax=Portunus trituberculatus TaxID=210409 RepID=A0A5B7FPZ1_PORTR|nr:hypothetical protein [Portunus trituberculatus]
MTPATPHYPERGMVLLLSEGRSEVRYTVWYSATLGDSLTGVTHKLRPFSVRKGWCLIGGLGVEGMELMHHVTPISLWSLRHDHSPPTNQTCSYRRPGHHGVTRLLYGSSDHYTTPLLTTPPLALTAASAKLMIRTTQPDQVTTMLARPGGTK